MRGASFRDAPLVDISVDDVRAMLHLNETLFVEHKGAEPVEQLAKAMASFANQLGGWVLVNITEGTNPHPIGPLAGWATAQSPVDAVRDRIMGTVASMPPFEAKTFKLDHDSDDVLVVRVYESADTPHIVKDGAIYVRGVAQDRRSDKWAARPIENPVVLRELVHRGERSVERVRDLLRPRLDLPLGNGGIGLEFDNTYQGLIPSSQRTNGPGVVARLAPLTLPSRFAGWACSREAVRRADNLLQGQLGVESPETTPHSGGFTVRGRIGADFAPLTEGGQNLGGPVTIGADAVGLVGLSTFFRERDPDWDITDEIDLKGFADVFVRRTIEIPALLLETASLLGRVRVHLWIFGMSRLLRISADDVTLPSVVAVPFEFEITLPTNGEELAGIAREAARAYGREAGVETFE